MVQLGLGSTVVLERDEQEFARLGQLGDVLGLTQVEVSQVHQQLSEQAFKMQVQQIAGDGVMTKDRMEAIGEAQKKLGLSEQQAQKIIKGVTNQRLIGNLQQLKAQGKLTLDRILELQEEGVEVESFMGEDMRMQLFRGEVERIMTDGSGSFDSDRREADHETTGLAAQQPSPILFVSFNPPLPASCPGSWSSCQRTSSLILPRPAAWWRTRPRSASG